MRILLLGDDDPASKKLSQLLTAFPWAAFPWAAAELRPLVQRLPTIRHKA